MGRLTTHVLDTASGKPGNGIPGRLYLIDGVRLLIGEFTTNEEGRVDGPLLDDNEFQTGTYELIFDVAEYFGQSGSDQLPFLTDVILRFHLSEDDDYHIPLLVSPWSYTTYRGS